MGQRSLISRIPRTARTAEQKSISVLYALVLLLLLNAGTAVAGDSMQQDCRIDDGPCIRTVRFLQVTFDLSPKPVKAMRELDFSVTVMDKGTAVTDASISVAMTMPGMVMGANTVMLKSVGSGRYVGKGVIVRCPTGEKIWKATVVVWRGGKTTNVPFLFEVH